MMYRMAQSPYLYLGQPEIGAHADPALRQLRDRRQRDVARSTWRRARRRSPTTGCTWRRTTSSTITDHDGKRALHPQRPGHPGARPGRRRSGRRHPEGRAHRGHRPAATRSTASRRPARPGTQEDNTNAWFVGFTPHLTTAVWVGDPNGYTPMENVPEFNDENREQCRAACTRRRSGRRTCSRPTSSSRSRTGSAPPAERRAPARLFLPGNECLYQITGYTAVVRSTARPPRRPDGFADAAAGAADADHGARPATGATGADRCRCARCTPRSTPAPPSRRTTSTPTRRCRPCC